MNGRQKQIKEEALETDAKWKAAPERAANEVDISITESVVNVVNDPNWGNEVNTQEPVKEKGLTGLEKLSSMAMTPEDYRNIADQEYYVKQFLPKGGLFMLVSDSGEGKSWVAFMLCKRVLLSHSKANVLFIDVDSGAVYTKNRILNLWRDYGQERFKYISQTNINIEDLEPILKAMKDEDLTDKIIVIDSLVGMTEGVVNESEKVKPFLTVLEGLRNAGATVILIHHVKKAADEEGKPVYAGSYTIKGAMDAIYALTKDDKVIECHLVKSRGDYVPRTFRITNFQGMLADDVEYKSPEEVKADKLKAMVAKQDQKLETFMLMARDAGEIISKTQLVTAMQDKLEIQQKYARAAVRRNVNHGVIEEVKGEKNKKIIQLKERKKAKEPVEVLQIEDHQNTLPL